MRSVQPTGMIERLAERFVHVFLKYMPSAYVFALLLTIITGVGALAWLHSSPMEVISSWYRGFFDLLAFAMQIVLIVITGYSIALSPAVRLGIDRLTRYIRTPSQVYLFVVGIGMILSLVSFGWLIITCLLARELAQRVRGVHYPFLVACAYFGFNSWVSGLSSSIPLLLNTDNNFLIQAGLLPELIPVSYTLQSSLNMAMIAIFVVVGPLIMYLLRPRSAEKKELRDLMVSSASEDTQSIEEEATALKLPFRALSDLLNNSGALQGAIVAMGLTYIVYHFATRGLDLDFNIMIFIFLMVGMWLHKTPSRYIIAMKRSSGNISGILFQYPFYAGIMGIMLYTGMGERIGEVLAQLASRDTYPFFAYVTGALVNFAIPSAGGEFAVIGPSLLNAIKELGAGLPQAEITAMISRASMSVAYGESLTNLLQPFFLLITLPVLGKGVRLQERDVMGYLAIPFIFFFLAQSALVLLWPV